MISIRWKSIATAVVVSLASLTLIVDDSFARGGGGGGSRGGGGFSSGSSGRSSSSGSSGGSFFRSTPAPTPQRYTPPSPPPHVTPTTPAPKQPTPSVTPGFKSGTPKAAEQPKTFDQRGQGTLKNEESRRSYDATHPSTSTANTRVDRDQHVRDLRKDLSREKWENRQLRRDQMYGRYQNQPPVFTQTYHDPFGNMFFWMWLMEQNSHSRDQWLYHHQNDVDPARLATLKEKDADLDRRLKALEKEGVRRDPSYVPPQFADNKDLMYGDDVVAQAAKEEHSSSNLWLWLGALMLLGAGVYLVFFKRWKPKGVR